MSPDDVIDIGVEGSVVSISSKDELNIDIYSVDGLLIKQVYLNANESCNVSLPSGIYIFRWQGYTRKISIR